MLGWLILGASIISLEVMNYIYYKKTVDYVGQKTLIKRATTTTWMKNYWLNELSDEEIIEWITNTIHFSKGSSTNLSITNGQRPRLEEISAPKMLKWVSYHMYFKPYKSLTENQITEAKLMMYAIENKLGHTFPDTVNDIIDSDLEFLKFGNTQIETSYKPVVVYCAMSTVKNLAYMYLKYLGFTKYTMNKTGIVYFYYKNPKNNGKTTLFVHGLGFGVTPYMSFIKNLMQHGDLILPILPNISNMEFHSILDGWKDTAMFPDYDDLRADFQNMLMQYDLYDVNIIGHSFGTIIMSILLRNEQFKKRIGTKIFVDPVCFMDDCYKIFNYIKQPDSRNGDLATSIFNSMIYEDVYVRYTTQRYLYGPEYWMIDYDNLKSNSVVVLSGDDKIVPSDKLHKKLAEHNIACIYVNNACHADIFSLEQFDTIINTIIDHLNHKVLPKSSTLAIMDIPSSTIPLLC
jgi:rhodanese-related sulfurtransferase